jgi:hypothetical protein
VESRIRGIDPIFFERLVLKMLVAMGYGGSEEEAAEHLGGSGDEGVDGVIHEDRLGLDRIYVQATRRTEALLDDRRYRGSSVLSMGRARTRVCSFRYGAQARQRNHQCEVALDRVPIEQWDRADNRFAVAAQPTGEQAW